VVEIGAGLPGSVCGRLLAGLGHDVIRWEPPGDEGGLRRLAPVNDAGDGLAYVALTAGKRAAPAGSAIPGLLDGADIAILDMTPREARALGLDPVGLRRDYPRLVTVWITGFGLDGEACDLPADSLLAEAYGGLATMIGEPGERPLSLGGEQAAYCAGVSGFLGAMLALRRGGGDLVEVAMCDVAAYMDWKSDLGYAMTGRSPRRSGTNPGDWRLVRASDGWVGFIFQAQHWQALVELIDAPELRDPDLKDEAVRRARGEQWWPAVERWARQRRAEDIYQMAQSRGVPFGWINNPSDLVRSPQLLDRGFILPAGGGLSPAVTTPVRAAGLPWHNGPRPGAPQPGKPEPGPPRARPLDGVVVLDFGTITAGAAVTRLLADYGATVLKIEWVDRPDTFRSWKMPAQALDSPYFPSNNVGKLGVAVNLKTGEGRDIVHRLVRHCQVMVENYRVGVTRRLGIDEETLHAINPGLLYVSLSSQGQTGPEAANSSYGSTLDLLSGLAALTGYGPGHPLWSSSDVNYPDQLVSLFGAAFVAYGLQRGIEGLYLDISQREVVSWTLAAEIADYLVNGIDGEPTGNRRPGRTPHDIYPCREPGRWVAIACGCDAQRRALAECVGDPELADHDEAWWHSHADLVDARVAAWTRRHARADAVAELRGAGVPAVPVLDAADRARDPRFARRQVVYTDAEMPVKGIPFLLREHAVAPPAAAPGMGEHTRTVLRDIAGLSDSEIDDYEARGVIYLKGHR
jgi:crotonobetainyl-CoA:carnitine CoA-transferase CaiB-like acyl-CoA transferase